MSTYDLIGVTGTSADAFELEMNADEDRFANVEKRLLQLIRSNEGMPTFLSAIKQPSRSDKCASIHEDGSPLAPVSSSVDCREFSPGATHRYCYGTVVFEAIKFGRLDIVQHFIDSDDCKCDVNLCDDEGRTLLYVASFHGQLLISQLLLENGANVNTVDHCGCSAIFIACHKGHDSIVIALKAFGADIHTIDERGRSPLLMACSMEDELTSFDMICNSDHARVTQLVEQVMVKGHEHFLVKKVSREAEGDVNHQWLKNGGWWRCDGHRSPGGCMQGDCGLFNQSAKWVRYHCQECNVNFCAGCVAKRRVLNPNYDDIASDRTSLLTRKAKIVQLLLDWGANVNSVDSVRRTALFQACCSGNFKAVEALVKSDADVSICEVVGLWNPLHGACSGGSLDTVRHLVEEARMDVNQVDSSVTNRTPLYIACYCGHVGIVRYLVEQQSADVTKADAFQNFEQTPLAAACREGRVDVVQYLLSTGLAQNILSANGQTLFYIACRFGKLAIVQLLEPNHQLETVSGWSPLIVASANGHLDVVRYLLEHHREYCDVNRAATKGGTPYYWACANNKLEVVKFLRSLPYLKDANAKSVPKIVYQKKHAELKDYLNSRVAYPNAKCCFAVALCPCLCPGTCLFACDEDDNALINGEYENSCVSDLGPLYGVSIIPLCRTSIFSCCGFHFDQRKHILNLGPKILTCPLSCPTMWMLTCLCGLPCCDNACLINDCPYRAGFSLVGLRLLLCCFGRSCVPKYNVNAAEDNKQKKAVDGNTAMHAVAIEGNCAYANFLIGLGADINVKNKSGMTPLHLAAQEKEYVFFEWLVGKGADIFALANDNKAAIDFIEDERLQLDILEKTPLDKLPLFYACKANKIARVSQLLNEGASAMTSHKGLNKSCLEIAIWMNNEEIVRVLLATGQINSLGVSLHNACARMNLDLISLVLKSGADIHFLDSTNKKAFDYIANYRPAKSRVLVCREFPLEALEHNHYSLWFYLIQQTSDVLPGISERIASYINRYPHLGNVVDSLGRSAIDFAAVEHKLLLKASYLIYGRYCITDMHAIHVSKTCLVYRGIDEAMVDDSGTSQKVALKFFISKEQYLHEVSTRMFVGFDSDFVVKMFANYPFIEQCTLKDDLISIDTSVVGDDKNPMTKSLAESLFCLVMPLGERTLFGALKSERWVGRNEAKIKQVFLQLLDCIDHLHSNGYIHGDLKPLNIIRDGDWKLIDLDACCCIGKDVVGLKSSTAYMAPELIYVPPLLTDNAVFCIPTNTGPFVRSNKNILRYGLPLTELVIAHPSFDIWSLGCILYQLMHPQVKPLFLFNQDDNLFDDAPDGDSLETLSSWAIDVKTRKLEGIPNSLCRNLLSQMLMKDPVERITLQRIRRHPFITGSKSIRFVDEVPEYDVFLSYRVSCDLIHAQRLYDMLIDRGLKVWWDKKSLKPGIDWKQGFIEGLMNSRTVVCLLSRLAVNHPTSPRHNFSKLTEQSPMDNMLFEQRLALELKLMGYVQNIMPLFVGDKTAHDDRYSLVFESGCMPISVVDISIQSLEDELIVCLDAHGLGAPLETRKTVRSVLADLSSLQGAKIEGSGATAFAEAADLILSMATNASVQYDKR